MSPKNPSPASPSLAATGASGRHSLRALGREPGAVDLPGLRFESRPPASVDELPPMDVAAFVGFASAGPVNLPVAVEDPARFRDLFGADPELGHDPSLGRPVRAHLGATVAAFFRGGGRRCHVVRVADAEAQRHRFRLPGLSLLTADSGWSRAAVEVHARSVGSWAAALRVGAAAERRRLGAPRGPASLSFHGPVHGRRASLEVASPPGSIRSGELLELVAGPGGPWLYAVVDAVGPASAGARLELSRLCWLDSAASGPSPRGAFLAVHRTTLELLAFRGELLSPEAERPWRRLGGLGYAPEHPRYWGHLPTDELLFALGGGRLLTLDPAAEALYAEAADPRFPFAAPRDLGESSLLLPLGEAGGGLFRPLPERPDPIPTHGADDPAGSRLERDGLAPLVEDASGVVRAAELFVDPDLARHGVGALLGAAEHKLYLRSEALGGLHALLSVGEVSLVAAPDAVHRGLSTSATLPAAPLRAPRLDAPAGPDRFGRVRFRWSAVDGAGSYHLETAAEPDFETSVRVVYRGPELSVPVPSEELLPSTDGCPRRIYARVRGEREGERGPFSENRDLFLPAPVFRPCAYRILGLAEPAVHELAGGEERVWWTAVPGARAYELQVAHEPAFSAPRVFRIDAERSESAPAEPFVDLPAPVDTPRYLRVRALGPAEGEAQDAPGDRLGPWSVTRVRRAGARSLPVALAETSGAPHRSLLAVQRALLRFCAARADLLALLSLPRGQGPEEARRHLGRLAPSFDDPVPPGPAPDRSVPAGASAGVPPLTLGEAPILGFGSIHHPWLASAAGAPRRAAGAPADSTTVGASVEVVSDAGAAGGGESRLVPPEGAVAGLLARHARQRGAWWAPANAPLEGVVALGSRFDRRAWAAFAGLGVNLVRRQPRGFLPLGADTLAPGGDARPIGVRRLLILLRRLCLRQGAGHVFEPDSFAFREGVRHRFEGFLGELHRRGAFAPERAIDAFRVVTDASVNPPSELDRGRFVVELRVAPSRPLAFLVVRLVQTGPQAWTFETPDPALVAGPLPAGAAGGGG